MPDLPGSIDRSSPVPFYFQLRQILEAEITSERWPSGHQLASEPYLSKHYGVSRTTVRQALQALEEQGLIRKEKGRGAFVARSSPHSWLLQSVGGLFADEATRAGSAVESQVLRADVEHLPGWAATALRLPPDAPGVTLERLRRVDGEVALYVVNHLTIDYAAVLPRLREDPRASLYAVLREQFGAEPAGSSRTVEAVTAPDNVARLLEAPRRSPMALIQSVTWKSGGVPVDCYRAYLRTDRLRIAIETQTWASAAGVRVISQSVVEAPAAAAGH